MFNVKNKLIQQVDKTIDIGEQRKITLSFMFEDEEFLDDDTFMLLLGSAVGDVYAFKNDGYLSFRNVDVSQIITSASGTFSIKAYVGQDEILDDEITITAVVNGQPDLSDYVTKSYLSSSLSNYVTNSSLSTTLGDYYTKTQTDGLFTNKLNIQKIADLTDTIAIAYDEDIDVVEIENNTPNATLTINPCTNYTAVNNEIPTFQLWIKPATTKTTITVSNAIKVIGDLPTELEAGSIHCFVFRFVGQDQLLNYAYSYAPYIKPLTLTAKEANSTVKIVAEGSPTTSGLKYRTDENASWSSYTVDTTLTLANVDDYVQFMNSEETLSTSANDYVQFVMSGEIEASGSVQSMLNFITSCKQRCYTSLFKLCTALTSAPQLPAMTLANNCYSRMFEGCSNLVTAPNLYAAVGNTDTYCYYCMFKDCTSLATAPLMLSKTLTNYCYGSMFFGCTALTTAPTLIATTLADYCYQSMFYGCSALTSAPQLPATTLTSNCYYYMFYNCSALASINVNFTDWGGTNAETTGWVDGVASEGTFTKPTALTATEGINNIPSGWTIVNK